MRKRILSFVMTLLLAFGCLPVQGFAVDSANNTTTTLEVGKTYEIPITRYGEDGKALNWTELGVMIKKWATEDPFVDENGKSIYTGVSTGTNLESIRDDRVIGEYTIQPKALVTPTEEGKYEVTLAWAHYEYLDMLQFLRQGIVENGESVESIPMQAKDIPEEFAAFKKSILTGVYQTRCAYSPVLKEMIKEQAVTANESDYIAKTVESKKDGEGYSYITVTLDNLDNWLYYKAYSSALYHPRLTADLKLNVDNAEDHASIKEHAKNGFIGGAIAFDKTNAKEVVDLSKYENTNASWQMRCATDVSNGTNAKSGSNVIYEEYASNEGELQTVNLEEFLKPGVQITQNDDGSMTATFTIAADSGVGYVYGVRGDNPYTTTGSASAQIDQHRMLLGSFYYYNFDFDTLNPLNEESPNTFSLTFSTAQEAAWGKPVQFTIGTAEYAPTYNVVLSVSATDNTVTFQDGDMTVTTEKDNLDPAGVFASGPVTGGAVYDELAAKFAGLFKNFRIYQPSFKVGGKKKNPANKVTVSIAIPEDWDTAKTRLYRLSGTTNEYAWTEIDETGKNVGAGAETATEYHIDNHTCVMSTKNLNNTTYIMAEDAVAVTADQLKKLDNGVYSLNIVSWEKGNFLTGTLATSMSDAAIVRSSARLVVSDKGYQLYYSLQPVYIDSKKGYAQRLFALDKDGSEQEYTYYSWVTKDDGSSVYNVDYYATNYGLYYPISVSTTFQYEDFAERSALGTNFWVPVMDEVQAGSEEKDPATVIGTGFGARDALLQFYDLEKLMDETVPTYEPSFLLKSVEDAEVYTKLESHDMYDEDKFAALSDLVTTARTALNQTDETGGTLTGESIYSQSVALDTATADLVNTSLTAQIDRVAGLKETDYAEDAWARIQTALENAVKVSNDTSATLADKDDALNKLYAAIEGLAEKADKTALKTALDNANAELEKTDDYTADSLASLETAIKTAQGVYDDDAATQTEVDAQVTALESAVKALVLKADKSDLQAMYDKYKEIYEAGNDAGVYDTKSWNAFVTAFENAKKVLDDANANESAISAARSNLINAANDLTVAVDKTKLKALLDKHANRDFSAYTKASADVMTAAFEAAKAVYADEDATQTQVNNAYKTLEAAANALIEKPDENAVYDGEYTIYGKLWQATRDVPTDWKTSTDGVSMGNAALNNDIKMTVKDGKATLTVEFVQNKYQLFGEMKSGYLGNLKYYADYNSTELPSGLTPVNAEVQTYWEDDNGNRISDDYGTDYPRYMSVPLKDLGQSIVWVQVYVPIMDEISKGTGTQMAKLLLDWDSREQISGVETDKTELNELIAQAKKLEQGEASDEAFAALQAAIASAEDISKNLNVDQNAVDTTAAMLKAAMQAVSADPTSVDKSELEQLIQQAQKLLKGDVTYTDATRTLLETALEAAQKVYARDDATQAEVNTATVNLDNAIDTLIAVSDKTALKKAIDAAEKILADSGSYSTSAVEALRNLTEQAKDVYDDSDASQSEVDTIASALSYMVSHMETVNTGSSTDKDGLTKMLMVASNMAGKESVYTADSLKALKKAIETALAVYDDKNATEEEVQKQISALTNAIIALEQKSNVVNAENNGNNNNGNNNGNNGTNNNGGTGENGGTGTTTLDKNNLADGTYYLTGKMVKVDKSTLSMSNDAIDHTIKLTVKDGKYTLTMNFKGLTVGTSLGYLSKLQYFKSGYTTDSYGAPQGDLAAVTVDAYQLDSSGAKIKDNYGTDYPATVSFEMISEALSDGYVPLQVFVPIMDSISSGTGTQPVYLSLDWSTLSTDSTTVNNNTNTGTTGTTGTGTTGTGTTSTVSGSKLPSSSTGTTGTSTLSSKTGSTGSTGTTGTSSLGSSSGKGTTGTTSVQTGDTEPLTGWLALLGISSIALVMLFVENKMRKKKNV